jgi:DNA polymerase-1
MIEIAKVLKDKNMESTMIVQVHDELIFDVVPKEKVTLQKLVTKIMENVIKLNVPLVVQTDFGSDWYEVK